MCNACRINVDEAAVDDFGGRLVEMLNHAGLAMMISLGHRTGLFDTMAAMEPGTSVQIADAAGLSERYVREWLGAMVTGRIVSYEASSGRYSLPAEHAALLTRASELGNFGVTMQWAAVLGSAEDEVAAAFGDGRGVPYAAYNRFHEVMAEESHQTVVRALEEHILGLVPEVVERLEAGIDVLDAGCGSGRALVYLAGRFPNSRFAGYDYEQPAIDAATEQARAEGLTNVRFERRDLAEMDEPGRYDLVTAFDIVHDQARPDVVLRNIRRSLKDGGTFLMQDIAGATDVADKMDEPLAPFVYTISCMHCMSVSLAQGGMGLGAAWGREKALEMLGDAGFSGTRVETLEHDILNYFYVSEDQHVAA
jgi:2-polyprenyl-3-methyl-5-hydroxy-6-metoxy-1,4-benzoquinol methylase